MPTNTEPRSPTLGQIALGAFLVAQFTAITLSNFLGFAKTTTATQAVKTAADRYCEVTGQPQGWPMFEAGYMRNSVAWDVRIELPDGRVERVASVAKLPHDVWYWNPPAPLSRRFVYESALLGIDLTEPEDRLGDFTLMSQEIQRNNLVYLAFFKSIYARVRKPDWPAEPLTMELAILRVPIFDPKQPNDTSLEVRYVARWRPGLQDSAWLPVETYDLNAPDEPYRRLPP